MPSGVYERVTIPARERFDARWVPEPNTGCWLWTGAIIPNGYGVGPSVGGSHLAHRVGWTLYRGPIPEGMYIDHLCRVRSCVNPDHLRPVTPKQNSLENSESRPSKNARKAQCPKGHPYSGENLWIRYQAGKPSRHCRACTRAQKRDRWRRHFAQRMLHEPELRRRGVEIREF